MAVRGGRREEKRGRESEGKSRGVKDVGGSGGGEGGGEGGGG